MAADAHLGVDLDLKSELAAELGQLLHVAPGFAAKAKIEALMHLAGVQFAVQNFFGELAGSEQGKVAGEGQQQYGIEAGGCQQAQGFYFGRPSHPAQQQLNPPLV